MSNLTLLDGCIVGVYLLATMVAGVMLRKYVGKVEDFLVAGREMNVYLISDISLLMQVIEHRTILYDLGDK